MTEQATARPRPRKSPARRAARAPRRATKAPIKSGLPAPAATSEATPARRAGDRTLLGSETLEQVDRAANAAMAKATMGMSPVAVAMKVFDWAAHLAASPGKQFQLAEKAARKAARFGRYAASAVVNPDTPLCIEPLAQDRRFAHPGWRRFPFNVLHQSFLLNQQWWHAATTGVRGVSKRNEEAVSFMARQVLDMMSPSNVPFLNPEIIEATARDGGANLMRGGLNFLEDLRRNARNDKPAGTDAYKVGENMAVTPGKVVFRNRLMELIQYEPTTPTVQREPILMLSAWMMKYYILDLSQHNSMVKYLVDRGHTVFMISWMNPGSEDRDLGMEDYRTHGIMAALDAISDILPDRKIHAVGYCLGGILLTIAAATMARDGDDRLASVTLFTTLTNFTEVGEMGVLMDTAQIIYLEDMMWQRGYLAPEQASGGFRMLRSRDLIWSKMMREYFLGEREPVFDLMAWNADGTRMPYRQHSELLRHFYRDNELFNGRYRVGGKRIAISDIHVPIFAVAASRDHVAPWHSVFKLHLQSDADELVFVLSKGGHNVGVIAEPGNPRRAYQMSTYHEGDPIPDPDTWEVETPVTEGSWWPAWQAWLSRLSSGEVPAPPMGAPAKGYKPLCDAPGTYVHQQ